MKRRIVSLLLALLAPVASGAPRGPLLLDAALAGDSVVAVGERGLVVRSNDGRTWTPTPAPIAGTLCAVAFAGPLEGWAAGHGAVILRTTDGGITWTPQFTGPDPEAPFLDLLALGQGHVLAVGAFGVFFESRDNGATWTQRAVLDVDLHLNRIVRTDDGRIYLAGESGTLLRSDDDGATWRSLETGDDGSLYGVLALRSGTLLAYGLRGRVYRSTDDGASWNLIRTPGTGLLQTGVESPVSGAIILAGQARTWWVSRDDGRTFRAATATTPAVAELLVSPTGELLSFGEDGAGPAPVAP